MVLSIIFMILNWIAFSGWMFVCYKLLVLCRSWNDDGYGDIDWMRRIIVDDLQKPVLALEGICIIEVFRLLLGQLKGNVILGKILIFFDYNLGRLPNILFFTSKADYHKSMRIII